MTTAAATRPLCPICRKNPVVEAYKPFCSKRCADRDLGAWLSDGYAIPGESADEAEEAPPVGFDRD